MKSMMGPKAKDCTLSVHNKRELLLKLEKAGLNDSRVEKVIESKDNELALKLIQMIDIGGFEQSASQKCAREIMGRNMFDVEDSKKYFGANPSEQQLEFLAEIPWSEEVLAACKDTHILVAIIPMSILDIFGHVDKPDLVWDSFYRKEEFVKDKGETGWYLIQKKPLRCDSCYKPWDEQQARLSKDEETPTAQVMVYAVIGHFLTTGERLFEYNCALTSSLAFGGACRIGVVFHPDCFIITERNANEHVDPVCVSRPARLRHGKEEKESVQ